MAIRSAFPLALALLAASCSRSRVAPLASLGVPTAEPLAVRETEPVESDGDALDDPAIWVDPVDRTRSLILATNKKDGLEVYGLDGKRRAVLSRGLGPDNVDVAYSIPFGSTTVDVALAATMGREHGLELWTIDPRTARIDEAFAHPVPVFGGGMPYGSTLWHRARDGALFAFVDDKRGRVEQYRVDGSSGAWKLDLVREFDVGSQVEGCVADDENGWFFVCEEQRAIWRYDADPEAPADDRSRVAVARVGGHGIVPDLEGITLYETSDGHGYLVASVQGASRFYVFQREEPHALVKVIDPRASATIGDVEETDGLVAESASLGPAPFDRGILIVQDGRNEPARQNLKLYAWPDVAGIDLAVDARRDPRKPVWRRR